MKKYSEENGWAKVKCDEEVGYVSAEFLADPSQVVDEPETPVASAQVGSKVEAIPGQHRNPNSAVVVIDPGHQRRGDSTKEPNGPGASVMKARVTGGTSGAATHVAEYILNLDISLKLKTELENRGYTVYMIYSRCKHQQYGTGTVCFQRRSRYRCADSCKWLNKSICKRCGSFSAFCKEPLRESSCSCKSESWEKYY